MLAFHIGPCRVQLNFSFFALIAFCCIFNGEKGGLECFLAVCLYEASQLSAMLELREYKVKFMLSTIIYKI